GTQLLQPNVEGDLARVGRAVLYAVRPAVPVGPELLDEGVEGGEPGDRRVRGTFVVSGPQKLQLRVLGLPNRVVVDDVFGVARLRGGRRGPLGRVGIAVCGRVLDPQVDRVDKAPARRRIRRGRHRVAGRR